LIEGGWIERLAAAPFLRRSVPSICSRLQRRTQKRKERLSGATRTTTTSSCHLSSFHFCVCAVTSRFTPLATVADARYLQTRRLLHLPLAALVDRWALVRQFHSAHFIYIQHAAHYRPLRSDLKVKSIKSNWQRCNNSVSLEKSLQMRSEEDDRCASFAQWTGRK
jgi:hypothetical protein